ncbi:hypothetical protein FQZ97_627490 [compost metagenome]
MHPRVRRIFGRQRVDPAARRAHAREQEVRFAAGSGAGLQVAQAVARGRHALQVDAEAVADLKEQPVLGLAAVAAFVGAVRAIEHRIHLAAHGREHLVHLGVHGVERSHVEQPAAQARLVRRHHHVPARMVQARHGLERTGQRRPLDVALDEVFAVHVDRAVAVEDDELHGGTAPGGGMGHGVRQPAARAAPRGSSRCAATSAGPGGSAADRPARHSPSRP